MKIITHVAALADNIVYSLPGPYRQAHVLRAIAQRMKSDVAFHDIAIVQGFLTANGTFVDRYDAYDLFIKHGQENFYPTNNSGQLMSLNCWPWPEEHLNGDWATPEIVNQLLNVQPFEGGIAPYRIPMVVADIYYRERVSIVLDGHDYQTQVAPILYSQLYSDRLDDPSERIHSYFASLLPSSNIIKAILPSQ